MGSSTPGAPPPLLPRGHLYLIDTMGYIFRAFHALPPLSNSRGLPTQAVLGFLNMLRRLVHDAQPQSLVAVYDLAGPTFREASFAAYKANRPEMPEALAAQLPYIRRVLEAYRVPILESTGYEADDVIGTVARQAAAAGTGVVIVSSDKDLLQLVGTGIRVFNPSKNRLLDAAGVMELMGVRPDQVADLLALRGDAVDNIPGAPGIGEKGALQLIQRFGSVEAALDGAAMVERKSYRESLQQHREQIELSKALATIHTEAPVEQNPADWVCQDPDPELCRELFTELEFHHLLKLLPGSDAAPPPAPRVAATPAGHAGDAAELTVFWNETPGRPVALAVTPAVEAGAAQAGLSFDPAASGVLLPLAEAAPALADGRHKWRVWDAKQLRAQLRAAHLPQAELELDPARVSDLALLAFLADPTQSGYSPEAITRRRYGAATLPEMEDASQSAATAWRLGAELEAALVASGQQRVYEELDLPLLPVLEHMEAAGVRIDPAQLARLSVELEQRCDICRRKVMELAGVEFNLNSPKQLGEVLFTKLGLPAPAARGKAKTVSTAVDVLEDLAHFEIVPPILEYRQLAKLKGTYVDALPPLVDPATGRLHTTFSLTGSATGRLASSDPNLQNIPIRTETGRQIRAAFVPDPGNVFVAADYSQIELRLLAHFSQDPLLLAAYRNNEDIHRLTASEVFGVPPLMISDEHRRRAKAVNFGIVYGLSAFGLARQLGIPQPEANQFIKRYFERYAGVRRYIDQTLEQARREGCVRTLFGRVRPIPNLDNRNANLRGFAERTAVNTPLQGTAADLIKLAMIRLFPRLAEFEARLLLQVHDELVVELPAARAAAFMPVLRGVMEGVAELSVPLLAEAGVGPNWRDIA